MSRDGSGSLDVVEIDAASHNGVDDARELRERAGFAPARDRYKIFILDEAHMVTQQGFNALLKIVEEPPEHVKFIFATTEPEKVIGTIRSRTHHYPFRLVPPAVMLDYVAELCVQEKVTVEDGVLPLVIRAGGGSVRDTLSLLDQIIAGSDNAVVTRERTNNLLGYTPGELLDESIEAIGRADAAHAFSAIDRVIQTGNDPRRFVEDVLERFRDLVIVNATGTGAAAVLRGVPQDEIVRMSALAELFGGPALSKAADIVNAALTGMTGTTPPRIHLELMVARLLTELSDGPAETRAVAAPVVAAPVVAADSTPTPVAAAGSLAELVEVWPAILEELQSSKGSWLVINSARPVLLEGDVLTLEFADPQWVERFKEKPVSGPAVYEDLREAIVGALGVRLRFVPRAGMTATAAIPPPSRPSPAASEPTTATPDHSETAIADDAPTTKMDPVIPVSVPTPETTAQTVSNALDEQRGESVVRDVLGAKLIATIDDTAAPISRTAPAEDGLAIFDVDNAPDKD